VSVIIRSPSGWPEPSKPGEEIAGQATVSDLEGGPIRHAFIRFVPRRAQETTARSFTVEATVDVDEDGNLMGVMIAWEV
jgi:hypothetical protein